MFCTGDIINPLSTLSSHPSQEDEDNREWDKDSMSFFDLVKTLVPSDCQVLAVEAGGIIGRSGNILG